MGAPADLAIRGASQIVTPVGPAPKYGREMERVQVIEDGGLAVKGRKLIYVGPSSRLGDWIGPRTEVVDATGYTVLPGFVDAHTHLIYTGDRSPELKYRLKGIPYQAVLEAGEGIYATKWYVESADDETIYRETMARLDLALSRGTTSIEIKSGYGLSVQGELRLLRLIKSLQRSHIMKVVPTLLALHAVPKEVERRTYIEQVVQELLPKVSEEGLAGFQDAFVDQGAFTAREAIYALKAGRELGLVPRVHAHEFSREGGVRTAYEVKAISADHLIYAFSDDIRRLSSARVVGVLLPASSLVQRPGEHAKARGMIEANMALALGTDANPVVKVCNMLFVMGLGCLLNGLYPEEAITAATLNAAYVLGLANTKGSLEAGKDADFVMYEVKNYLQLLQQFAERVPDYVYCGGRLVAEKGRLLIRTS
jgi:imidazolonepropionase